MNSVTLTASNLSFGYSDSPVLEKLDISFEPGTFHAIVGPNGSGKSTLLDLLSGHRTPSSGCVRLNDQSLSAFTAPDLATRMALVPQETSFNFPFTVFETVLMGCHPRIPRFSRPSEQDIAVVQEALSAMDLAELADRTIPELSGGERQRTIFARALAQATPCLLLDEPTSSMDIRHALTVMNLLRKLAHEENSTIVAVLHDLNLAAAHCDQMTIIKDGNIHASGTPESTLTPEVIRDVFGVTAHVAHNPENAFLNITYDSKDIS